MPYPIRVLRDRISDEMRAAMKAREQTRVSTLRMLMAAMKNTQVEKGHELSDDEVLEVVAREAKRRRESMEAFEKGGRAELVEKEGAELAVLEAYLPEQLGEDELGALVDEAIAETGASSPKEMGAVMKVVMGKVKGRADGAAVSAMVRARLGA
ncbi:MAG: GatB/YqeY domain-containing protein [Actinobacteria bacterium]|nr:MAG: GatB/YqeY domain-containing protein [Actinomycetota bacterium]TML79864.1 MAG: GatB/YqeY domain-containing protein [Actinomycetota bacterium]